jgi:hypothetical protein
MQRFVEIVYEDGAQKHALTTRTTLGSDASCDIVLVGHPDIAPRHLVLDPRESGCEVAALPDSAPPITAEGKAHAGGLLPWGTEIHLGAVLLRLESDASTRRTPSIVVLLAPIVLGIALFSILSEGSEGEIAEEPEAPALFTDDAVTCSSGAAPAHHRAERDELAASAKIQRYPFAPRDGVQAVALLAHARACYAASGDGEGATRVEARAARLRTTLVRDYDGARFRLARAIRDENWRSAVEEARALLSLLSGRDGAYVEWLISLERRLRLTQGER